MKAVIAEQYRDIKPHIAEGKLAPLAFRWRCILLDQDTEYPPFEPCKFFVVSVFAETRDQVIDCLAENYPWCDIMVVNQAFGLTSDDNYLDCWLNYYDNTNQTPTREAPHKNAEKEKMKNPSKISDTTLLNFMLSDRVICRYVLCHDTPVFTAENDKDNFHGNTPREALRGLYILLKEKR